MNSKADVFLLYSIIENILKRAETPAGFGDYLSEQIKSIIGVKTVIVYSYDEIDNQFKSLGVCPARNKDFAVNEHLFSFLANFVEETQNIYLEIGDNSSYQKELKKLGLENALVIPLVFANNFEGLILLCDVYDNHNITDIIDTFTKISSLAAIVLRNSKLYNNLEKNVERRTEELSKKSEEYERLYKELLQAKQRAEKVEESFSKLFNSTRDGYVINKGSGEILNPNPAYARMLGYTIEEMTRVSWIDITPEKWLDWEIENHGKQLMSRGFTDLYEKEYIRKNGEVFPVQVQAFLLNKPDKLNDALIAAFVRDITEQKNREKELEKYRNHLEYLVKERTDELEASNEELRVTNDELYKQRDTLENTIFRLNETQTKLVQSEKMASLGVLVAGVAHEINNPVNFINSSLTGLKNNLDYLSDFVNFYQEIDETNYKTILDALKKKEASLPDVFNMFRKSIEIIEIGVQRTTKIVKSLKSFARADEKELGRYNLHENIDNTLLILYSQYKERIEIKKEYGQIPLIVCYPGQINQVIMNVLTNAIHAIPVKGTITVTTQLLENDKIEIKIEDTGMGINQKELKKIFDPFFTTKDVGKGTGLGLSISYSIIKDHKGEIMVESGVGKGSCFRIILPIKQL